MRTRTITLLLTMLLALGMMAGPALANADRGGNSLRSTSTAVDVESVTHSGDWYVIRHNLDASPVDTVWNEAVKYANDNQAATGVGTFNDLYLFAPSHERGHKGQVTVYYDLSGGDGDEWVHVTAQFNGEGELQHANGVTLE